MLEPKLGGAKIEGVQPAPVPGLWEVRLRTEGGRADPLHRRRRAAYVIDGSIHELRTDRDLTEERLRKLNAIKFESLPLDLAVKVQRGNGKRVLAMFSDPYCPACRKFERALAQIDDITVYVFMYPVIRPENADHSRAVWCSPDRAKAWLELAAAPQPKVPDAPASCANPVDKVLEVGRKLGVNSTPTLFLANGERMSRRPAPPTISRSCWTGRQRLAARPEQPHPSLLAHAPGLRAGLGPGSPEEIRAHHAADRAAGVVRRHQALERLFRKRKGASPGTPARRAARSAGRPRGCARRAAARRARRSGRRSGGSSRKNT